MVPFNIQIDHGDEKITLTIIPKEDYYIIVYFGSILGAIRKMGLDWILLQQDEIDPGMLEYFDHKQNFEGTRLSLGIHEINLIAGEIENHLVNQ
jgi:hypothetical protein